MNLYQPEGKINPSVTERNSRQVFKAPTLPTHTPWEHMSFSADPAHLCSSKPSQQPLSQVKTAVTSAQAQLVAMPEAVPTRLFTLCSFDRAILETQGLGYNTAAVPATTDSSSSSHLLIKSSELETIDVLGKVWSKAISSYFPSYSPVRHSQATIRSPSRGRVSEPMLSLYDPRAPGCCPHPHIYNVAPV